VTNTTTGAAVLNQTLSQPGDIPLVAPLADDVRNVLTSAGSFARPIGAQADLFQLNGKTFADVVASLGGAHLPQSKRAMYPDSPAERPYGSLDVLVLNGALIVPGTMGAFTDFNAAQRELLLQVNMARNGGTLRSDDPADPCPVLDPRGAANAPEIDHIIPKVLGGSNFFSNARIVSWQLNNKEDRIKPIHELIDVSRLAAPSLPTTIDARVGVIVPQWLAHHPDTDEIAPTALSGWITTRWPALGPELLPPRLLNAVLKQLADKGVKQKTKHTANKSTKAGAKKRGFKKPIKKKQRHRHLVK